MSKNREIKQHPALDPEIISLTTGHDYTPTELWRHLTKCKSNVPCETIGEVEGFENE